MRKSKAHWPLLLASMSVFAFSCGGGDSGGGAGGGVGGSSQAGSGTSAAGAPGVGGANPGVGASLGEGAAAGQDSAASAGVAGASTLGSCGDGHVDPGEQCDDGNTEAGDGCSGRCTSEACEACLAMFGAGCGGCVVGPNHLVNDAEVALCEAVLRCARRTRCVGAAPAGQFSDPTVACYCGTLTQDACLNAAAVDPAQLPDGDCARDIAIAVGNAPTPMQVETEYFDAQRPLGAALGRASCEQSYCALECGIAAAGAGGM